MNNIITATSDQQYLSDVINELPLGILNKTQCNVGGSFLALNSPHSYIIVVPTIDLIENKLSNPANSIHELFGVYGKVSQAQFKKYIERNTLHHILVTFDSLPKLINWLLGLDINAYDYRVLFDEYHMLLTEMGYRSKAIESLVKEAKNFTHYTFMSATPIPEKFLPQVLAELPYTEIQWTNTRTLIPTRVLSRHVFQTTVKLLKELSETGLGGIEVKEFFIFTNTVLGIKQILDSAELDPSEVKVICAKTLQNEQVLDNYKVSNMTGANKKYNFFTSKGFQGCDLYSKSGLAIVVSDSKKKHTLTDIQTTLYQISGRIRDIDNVFADKMFHIYSTGYVTQTKKEYEAEKKEIMEESLDIIERVNNFPIKSRITFAKRLSIDDGFLTFDEETKNYSYSDLKEKFSDFNFELTQYTYTNGLSIKKAYEENGIEAANQVYSSINTKELQLIKRITRGGFKSLLEQYIELREKNNEEDKELILRYEFEHPIFKEAYNKLGKKTINSCKFQEKTIKEKLYSKSNSSEKAIAELLQQYYKPGNQVSIKDAKVQLQSIYDSLKIKAKAKGADIPKYIPSKITKGRLGHNVAFI